MNDIAEVPPPTEDLPGILSPDRREPSTEELRLPAIPRPRRSALVLCPPPRPPGPRHAAAPGSRPATPVERRPAGSRGPRHAAVELPATVPGTARRGPELVSLRVVEPPAS